MSAQHWSRRTATLIIALIGVGTTSAATATAGYVTPEGRIRIVGYNDMDQMLTAILRPLERAAGVGFELDLHSTRSAPGALIAGTSLLAPMGAEMEPDDRAAFRAAWGNDPIEFRIAHDSLTKTALSSPTGIIIAAANPLRSIDIRMARRVFVRQPGAEPIARWGDLGVTGAWTDRAIHPIGLATDTAIGRFVLRHPFAAVDYVPAFTSKRQSRDVAAAVAVDPDAIGLANLSSADNGVRALAIVDDGGVVRRPTARVIASGRYPLDRFLLVYARADRQGHIDPLAARVLRALLSRAGQKEIGRESRGYLPLAPSERREERNRLDSLID